MALIRFDGRDMKSEQIAKTIYITEQDLECLELILDMSILKNDGLGDDFGNLLDHLDNAAIIDQELAIDELVVMNSRVSVRFLDSNRKITFDLVRPEGADLNNDRVSVLAPMGAAVLGCRIGDIVEFNVVEGRKRLKIEKVLNKNPGNWKLS
jgi:regulator of nucleoside diphosphate kinase